MNNLPDRTSRSVCPSTGTKTSSLHNQRSGDLFRYESLLWTPPASLGSPGAFSAQGRRLFFGPCFTVSTNVNFSHISKNDNLISRCLVNRFPASFQIPCVCSQSCQAGCFKFSPLVPQQGEKRSSEAAAILLHSSACLSGLAGS